jgi:hypothetical protein
MSEDCETCRNLALDPTVDRPAGCPVCNSSTPSPIEPEAQCSCPEGVMSANDPRLCSFHRSLNSTSEEDG